MIISADHVALHVSDETPETNICTMHGADLNSEKGVYSYSAEIKPAYYLWSFL